MKKYVISSITISCCLLLSACNNQGWNWGRASSSSTKQTIDMNLSASNTSWNVVNKRADDKGAVVTMMPKDQNLSNWKEGIRTTTILYKNNPNVTAQNFVQDEMMRAKKHCSQVDSSIISQTASFTTYQLNIQQCSGGYPDQTMFGKAFNGIDGVYAARYSAKMNQMPNTEVDTMSKVIQEARLVSN